MGDSSSDENNASWLSYVGEEGELVEIRHHEDIAKDLVYDVPCAEVPNPATSLCNVKDAKLKPLTIGLFLGNLAPFGEPHILVGTTRYIVSPQYLKKAKNND